ncbi:Sec20 domain containing protein [Trichuris trichiura]|uniref:Sec20 domain containing protein n=1 Tax=Trichuris trichiura TaxID=36087 RepID=A0A077Z4T2_TRITR|nr:Sec20 domain containing protein [Trichuris trichiura]
MDGDTKPVLLRVAELRKEISAILEDVRNSIAQIRHFEGSVTDLQRESRSCRKLLAHLGFLLEHFGEISKVLDNQETRKENIKFFHQCKKEATDLLNRLKEAMAIGISNVEARQRALLLNSPGDNGVRCRIRANLDGRSREGSKVASELGSLLRKMHNEVRQSEETLSVLVSSSTVLQETGFRFQSFSELLKTSSALLSKYGRRRLLENCILLFLILVFFISVAYIVYQRLPLRYFSA